MVVDPSTQKDKITILEDEKNLPVPYHLSWSAEPIIVNAQDNSQKIDNVQEKYVKLDDEISKTLQEEKTRSLRLLDKMFGDIEHKTQEKLNNDEKILSKKRKINTDEIIEKSDRNVKRQKPDIELPQLITSNSKDNRFIKIHTDLVSLFKGRTSFSLTSIQSDVDFISQNSDKPKSATESEISIENNEPTCLDNNSVMELFNDFKNNKSDLIGATFIREGTLADIEAIWKETCQTQTRDYKKKA